MKTKLVITSILLVLMSFNAYAQDTLRYFHDLENLIYNKSLSLKKDELQLSRAKAEKLAALYGLIDPAGSINGTYTNNTKRPVNLIPSEILGGQPGTFQEVQFGTRYVTNINAYAEIKLINFQGWENFRQSNINIKVNETGNKVFLKTLLENAAVIYFNIINLQEQITAYKLNSAAADTLYRFTLEKYKNGLASHQDLNDSRVNKLGVEESIRQLQFQTAQQYVALKILCDFPDDNKLIVAPTMVNSDPDSLPFVLKNSLIAEHANAQVKLALSAFDYAKLSFVPYLSVYAAYQKQQFNTHAALVDRNNNWSESNYIGLKLSVPLPSAESIRQTKRAKYDYLMAEKKAEQKKNQAELEYRQLLLEYEKAKSQLLTSREVLELQNETYKKNLINYNEGIIGLEPTLNSFNSMIRSQSSYLTAAANLMLAEENIQINNKIY
ncbi:MAG: TolC family protein [Bacillota bacterium]